MLTSPSETASGDQGTAEYQSGGDATSSDDSQQSQNTTQTDRYFRVKECASDGSAQIDRTGCNMDCSECEGGAEESVKDGRGREQRVSDDVWQKVADTWRPCS